MDGAVPGKHHTGNAELPILIWGFNYVDGRPGARRQTYVVASTAESGRFVEIPLEEVSVDWRLVDNAWIPLYDDGEEDGDGGPES